MICDCGTNFGDDLIFPIRCSCGLVHEYDRPDTMTADEAVALLIAKNSRRCDHLGDRIGRADCGCSGVRPVHYCSAFDNWCLPLPVFLPSIKLKRDEGSETIRVKRDEINRCGPACDLYKPAKA